MGLVICVLGVSKWLFGALLFAGFWNKKIGVLGFGGMRQGHEAKHKAQIPRDRERQPRSSGDDSPRITAPIRQARPFCAAFHLIRCRPEIRSGSPMYFCRLTKPLPGLLLLLCSLPTFAQALQPRLGKTISGSPRATLSHSRSPRVRTAEDLGAVPPDMPIPGITLVFRRSPQQEAGLKDLLAEQQIRPPRFITTG